MTCMTIDDEHYGSFPQYGFGFFATGGSVRFYRYSLFWLVHYAGLDNVAAEIMKDGEPLLYGQISVEELDRLAAEGRIADLKRHFWGVSWLYRDQPCAERGYDFSSYPEWHHSLVKDTGDLLYCRQGGLGESDFELQIMIPSA